MAESRFGSPALELDLKILVRKSYRVLLISFLVASVFHLSLARVSTTRAERTAVKPLTTLEI